MSARRVIALVSASLITITLAAVVPIEAQAASTGPGSIHSGPGTVVDARTSASAIRSSAVPRGPLGRDARPVGAGLPSMPATGQRRPVSPSATVKPFAVTNKFTGLNYADTGCACYPPDVTAAVGPNDIVEVVNAKYEVYSKAGAIELDGALDDIFGTADLLVEPRVLYDPSWNRWVIVASGNSGPTLFLGISQTGDPTGTWIAYTINYPLAAGSFLDFPMVGMDRDAVVVTTNNFGFDGTSLAYTNSTAFAVSKSLVYNGLGFGSSLWGVAFGTAPAVSTGYPTIAANFTYLVGLDATANVAYVYRIANSGNKPTFSFRGQAPYAWDPASRQINQPGNATTLSPGDGRITSPVVYDGNRLWFAHTVDFVGFPSVRYGFVSPGKLTVTWAQAFHTASSDDFNPSISMQYDGTTALILLNWAYTDTFNATPVTDVYKFHVGALTRLVGDPYSAAGGSTNETKVGAYSSAVPEYDTVGACATGKNALIANEYFSATTGDWKTQIARVHTTC